MTERILPDFDIGQIARSGQCFRFRPLDEGRWALIAGGRYLEISQQGQRVTFDCPRRSSRRSGGRISIWTPTTAAIKRRSRRGTGTCSARWRRPVGLRILRQELWETIVCFIISQQNNIARITGCVERLCERFGAPCTSRDGKAYFAFPTAGRLAACTADDLVPIRLGYRAKYILTAARQVVSGEVDLEAVRQMDYAHAKAALMRLSGVGVKVAECICLFALHHIDAFPVDTHIRQMLDAHYPKGFPLRRYKGFAGVMQQYAFIMSL